MKFIAWLNFPTPSANRDVSPSQVIKDAIQESGGSVELLGFPQSQYDALVIYDAPDVNASTTAKIRLQQQGYQLTTSTFVDSNEHDRIWDRAVKMERATRR